MSLNIELKRNADKSPVSTKSYGYSSGWGDMLTSYDGTEITYDQIGNPTNYSLNNGKKTRHASQKGYAVSFFIKLNVEFSFGFSFVVFCAIRSEAAKFT